MAPQPAVVASQKAHFLYCGAGAIIPALCQLALVDLKHVNLVGVMDVLGWVFRTLVLFVVGGMIAHFLYFTEQYPAKLFYAGLATPAMILALANGQKLEPNPPQQTPSAVQREVTSGIKPPAFWISSWTVHAADLQELKTFAPRTDEGLATQFVRGIFGGVPTNIYFALAGSYSTLSWAQSRLVEVRTVFPTAEIYGPSGGNTLYSIVIGAHQTADQSQAVVKRALINLFTEAYVWRLGDAGVPPSPGAWADQLGDKRSSDTPKAARAALVQCGAACIPVIRGILKDPTANIVRDMNLLMTQLTGAIADLEKNGIAMPQDVELQLADFYYDRNQFDISQKYFANIDSKTLAADPDQYCRRGFARYHGGDLIGANEDYKQCVGLKPNATAIDHRHYGSTQVQLGMKAESAKQPAEAKKYYQTGLDEINVARKMGDPPGPSEGDFRDASNGLARLSRPD